MNVAGNRCTRLRPDRDRHFAGIDPGVYPSRPGLADVSTHAGIRGYKDGTVSSFKDGTAVTLKPDGKRIHVDANGKRRELDEDEEIAYRLK